MGPLVAVLAIATVLPTRNPPPFATNRPGGALGRFADRRTRSTFALLSAFVRPAVNHFKMSTPPHGESDCHREKYQGVHLASIGTPASPSP